MFLLILLMPVIALFEAFVRALFLFFPLMIVLHFLHNFIPAVPALGWKACFLVIAALTLLIPTSAPSND
jgi:hypothetical protein